jgi:hypothetical protein
VPLNEVAQGVNADLSSSIFLLFIPVFENEKLLNGNPSKKSNNHCDGCHPNKSKPIPSTMKC